jgi:hypothetical protein
MTCNKFFVNVAQFRYLGEAVINKSNKSYIQENVKEQVKCQNFLYFCLLSWNLKINVYKHWILLVLYMGMKFRLSL